jgi:hypothetical protein
MTVNLGDGESKRAGRKMIGRKMERGMRCGIQDGQTSGGECIPSVGRRKFAPLALRQAASPESPRAGGCPRRPQAGKVRDGSMPGSYYSWSQ